MWSKTDEIKSCPFCGANATIEFDDEPCYHGSKGLYFIRCAGCGARSGFFTEEGNAVASWNNRKV